MWLFESELLEWLCGLGCVMVFYWSVRGIGVVIGGDFVIGECGIIWLVFG